MVTGDRIHIGGRMLTFVPKEFESKLLGAGLFSKETHTWTDRTRDKARREGDVVEILHFTKALNYGRRVSCLAKPD